MRNWDYNYHSHTARCGHAEGQDEDFVYSAIKARFKKMGFSDHVFIPNFEQPGLRGSYAQLEEYLHSVDILRKRYEGVIDIYTGFEAEYSPYLIPYYKELLSSGKVDYLIQGQHSEFDGERMEWYSRRYPSYEEAVEHYTDDLIAGMESGLFLYAAHPDFFLMFRHCFDQVAENAARRIAKASKRTGIPLEVNMGHSRYGILDCKEMHDYPCHEFWDIVSEYGCDVVFGVDAHRPNEYTHTRYELFAEFASLHRLHLVEPHPKHSDLHKRK